MKRIIIATISVILSVAVSAQDRTPMDKIWEEIEKITTARQDSKMNIRPQRHSRKGIPLFNRLRRRYNFF